jgi:hypothetical protein
MQQWRIKKVVIDFLIINFLVRNLLKQKLYLDKKKYFLLTMYLKATLTMEFLK